MKKDSFLRQANLFLRSCVFSCVLIGTVIPYSFICVSAFILPLRYRYAMVTGWTYLMLRVLKIVCHVDYQVEGTENIPKNRNGVVLSKHQSTWETFLLPNLFHEAAIITKRELLWVPFFGWGLACVEPIAINRSKTSTAMEQIIKQGKKCLEASRWILIFPEGTRIPPGKIGNYRAGGAILAVKAGCPVIPVAHNAGRYWLKRKFIKQPGTIRMVIGPLIETNGKTSEEVLAEAKNWIEKTMLRIDQPGPN